MVRRALAGPKKGADQEGRIVVWVDESAFYLLPGAVRTYAPRGRTPILRLPLTRDHLSVISGITPAGRLLMRVQARPYKSPDIVRFLKHLLRHIPGKLLVLWDGAPIHRGQPVKDFLAQGAAERIRLESFPGYAPDLNPDEGTWRYLKHVELRNLCCETLAPLRRHRRLATARLRHKRSVIHACAHQCGYYVYTKPGWPRRISGSAATRRLLGLRGDVTPRLRAPRKMRHRPEGLVLVLHAEISRTIFSLGARD